MSFSEFVLGFPINKSPAANAGEPYTINEGETLILDASSSSDPDNDITSYKWDLDNDGEFDDAEGITVEFPASDDDVFSVNLKATDVFEEFDTDSAQVTVTNVLPKLAKLLPPLRQFRLGRLLKPGRPLAMQEFWIRSLLHGIGEMAMSQLGRLMDLWSRVLMSMIQRVCTQSSLWSRMMMEAAIRRYLSM